MSAKLMRTQVLAASLAIVAAVALTGCSDTSANRTATPPEQAAHDTACSLATPAQIQSTLGHTVGKPTTINSTGATTCSYPATPKSDSVLIVFRGGVTADQAATQQAKLAATHGSTTDVSGPGIQAYYYSAQTQGGTVTSLVTLVHQTELVVTSTASASQMEALSKQIFASLASQATTTTTPLTSTSTTAVPAPARPAGNGP
jgi:hypothetical protein